MYRPSVQGYYDGGYPPYYEPYPSSSSHYGGYYGVGGAPTGDDGSDSGARAAEEFIHRCMEQGHSTSRPPSGEEFVRMCREDRRYPMPLPPEEEFIRMCQQESRYSVNRLPPEDDFIRQCKSGSRPPDASLEEEFIRQCKSGSRLPRSVSRLSRSPSRSPARRRRSPTRSLSRRLSPSRSLSRRLSPSRSPARSVSRRTRSPTRSLSRRTSLSRSPIRQLSPRPASQLRGVRPSRSRDVSRTDSGHEPRRSHSCDSHRSQASTGSDETSAQQTKRRETLDRWRRNNCSSKDEMSNQLEAISKMRPEEIIEKEKTFWTRTAPADLYYERAEDNPKVHRGNEKLLNLCHRFETELIQRAVKANEGKPPYVVPIRRHKMHHHRCCAASDSESEGSVGESGEEDEGLLEELERKKSHPDRLHPELWYNDPGEMNDGPLCRCSAKAKRSGIRHNIYAGELNLEKCDVLTNNADRLYHYRITVSPPNNFLIKTPTIIEHDNHEYIFEGFSMFSHKPLENLPVCKVIRFNIEYTILYIKEKHPEHFIIKELDLFYDFLFKEILELVDLDFKAAGDSNGCSQFHFMPRFVRELPENGKELLSMNEVLNHLLRSSKPLISMANLKEIVNLSNYKWQNYVDDVKGMVVTFPGKKPCSLRVDQLDRDQSDAKPGKLKVPEIVHFGIRPPQLSYAGNPEYQKAWREYVKFRHLLANMPKASFEDKRKLESKENKLQEMRTQSKMKRDVTIAISAEGFYRTGIMCDIVQHAMLIPVLVSHLRFHRSLDVLEADIKYTFQNRSLLQLALTHPSYRENFGTNPDHARNSLTNCSIRQPEYGDRRIHYLNTRKRGINTLINIMSRFGKKHETESNITHNERLEFLGDAVVEFVTSIHLFHLFPRLEEGGLATYRAAIVQNQHLAVLAKKLGLDGYMLYAHGSDLCHDLELRHAMANCFEALMGALFLDGGIEAADRVFGESLFKESAVHLKVWEEYPPHPLQEQEPNGDRQWIPKFQILQNLTKFEDSIGVKFTHIRLLARAFTDRSIGFTNLTLGSNQRLEFLGDTVLQLIASDYLYKYFPEHHEGHLSLLRSSLVNNRTQAVVCDDLGIGAYALYATPKAELKTKDRADLLEAFLGALYVDKGLRHCETFCNVCFFPRLHDFIMHQDWNDPKSKLQQCCLTLRTMEGGEPEIPIYKVIECMGPTNTRLYTVAVYFKGKRLAQATGHSIQQAEMNAAKEALDNSQKLFPQLDHQKRVIAKSIKQDPPSDKVDERDRNKKAVRRRRTRERSASVRSSMSRDSNSSSTGSRGDPRGAREGRAQVAGRSSSTRSIQSGSPDKNRRQMISSPPRKTSPVSHHGRQKSSSWLRSGGSGESRTPSPKSHRQRSPSPTDKESRLRTASPVPSRGPSPQPGGLRSSTMTQRRVGDFSPSKQKSPSPCRRSPAHKPRNTSPKLERPRSFKTGSHRTGSPAEQIHPSCPQQLSPTRVRNLSTNRSLSPNEPPRPERPNREPTSSPPSKRRRTSSPEGKSGKNSPEIPGTSQSNKMSKKGDPQYTSRHTGRVSEPRSKTRSNQRSTKSPSWPRESPKSPKKKSSPERDETSRLRSHTPEHDEKSQAKKDSSRTGERQGDNTVYERKRPRTVHGKNSRDSDDRRKRPSKSTDDSTGHPAERSEENIHSSSNKQQETLRRQRREPSDEGEILSESSLDSR